MFEALIQLEVGPEEALPVTRIQDATPAEMTEAMLNTANLLQELGLPTDEDIDERMQRQEARQAFSEINFNMDDEAQKAQLARLKSAQGVHHLVGMLSAYDFEFVDKAKELREYTVAKILELTENGDPKIRLKALKLLGDVTEVGLFTTKVEVKNVTADEAEINRRLEERLQQYLNPAMVVDTTARTIPDAK
jgi:PHP family Zn ribbon phosphoesterase